VVLASGETLPEVTLAYEIYGELNRDRSNAVLVFHALTGSQHAAGFNRSVPGVQERWTDECQTGWWDDFIGPGRALDTEQFAVICVNYLGGCYGSTGPASMNPASGRPYGSAFPEVGFSDIVDSQVALLDELGIERLHAVTGASVGGVMALSLATRHPARVGTVIPIAAGLQVTPLQLIHNFEQINAIVDDDGFAGGDYYHGPGPVRGLALARMIGHKTFVSLQAMEERARNEVVGNEFAGPIRIRNPLESYMWHQGQKFVARFDANTYLRLMQAWQTSDLPGEAGASSYPELFQPCRHQRYMVFSIDSDVCYYPEDQRQLVAVLKQAGIATRHITIHSDKGHDAFLLEPELFEPHLVQTLQAWS
jgi:homoserine O-acetyltransferase